MQPIKTLYKKALKPAAFALLCTVASAELMAMPAKKTPVKIVQPDGTEITVIVKGDEFFHYTTTEDNLPVCKGADGVYYYQRVNANGQFEISDVKASEIGQRSEIEKEYIKTLNIEQLNSAIAGMQKVNTPARRVMSRIIGDTTYPTTGKQKGLVILVEFKDKGFTISNPKEEYTNMLNQKGYSNNNATGSAFDYFYDASNGLFEPEFDVYGPITMPENMEYYGGNDPKTGQDKAVAEMIVQACKDLDDEIDYKEYDRNNDGIVDNVYVFYAGYGENDSYDSNTIWPQTWDIYNGAGIDLVLDGVRVQTYACSNEMTSKNVMCGIGTFCHEFSHVLGLPDLYATETVSPTPFTPGPWSILDYGPYNNDGRTPPTYTAYERYTMGWLTPVELNKPASVTLDKISANQAYIIKTPKENEYFLLENRQQDGWDKYLPGHGMLIWHIDYNEYIWQNNAVSNTPAHQYVDIEEADDVKSATSRAADTFPGEWEITEFTDDTRPDMRTWDREKLGKPITNIAEKDGKITFDFMGGSIGIEDTEAGQLVKGAKGCIVVELSAESEVEVYDLSGKNIATRNIQSGSISAERGMYIVKAADKLYKVTVW